MLNLLFVDDEQSVLDGLRRTLRPLRPEWKVSFANGGRQALDLLNQFSFDAVITDMRMPGMDGNTLLKHAARDYPNLLRVVLSGQSEMESHTRPPGLTHHYLSKPCSLDVLSSTLNRAFSIRRLFADPALLKLVSAVTWDQLHTFRRASRQDLTDTILDGSDLYKGLLKVVQTAGFIKGAAKPDPGSLLHALGTANTAALLMGAGLGCSSLGGPHTNDSLLDHGWTQYALRSSYAERIARFLAASAGDVHYQSRDAGLLIDVGQLVMRKQFPDLYRTVEKLAAGRDIAISQAEREVFGTSHAGLSAYILAQAGHSDATVEAAAFHHAPSTCPHPRSFVLLAVHIADLLSRNHEAAELPLDLVYLNSLGQAEDLSDWRKVAVRN